MGETPNENVNNNPNMDNESVNYNSNPNMNNGNVNYNNNPNMDNESVNYNNNPNMNNGNVNYNSNPNMNNGNVNYNSNPNMNNGNVNYNSNPNMNNNKSVLEEWGQFDPADMENNMLMAILGYVIPFVPYFVEKNSKWVRFHSVQGMNLLIISIIVYLALGLVSAILSIIPFIGAVMNLVTSVVSLCMVAFMGIGIYNVVQKQPKELPMIGYIKFFKK